MIICSFLRDEAPCAHWIETWQVGNRKHNGHMSKRYHLLGRHSSHFVMDAVTFGLFLSGSE